MARPAIDPESRTIRFDMMMSEAQMERVDDWRFENRISTRAEAFRRLIDIALEQEDSNA